MAAERMGSGPTKSRTWFREDLGLLEQRMLEGLQLVVAQLDRALDAITFQDAEMAAMVAADDRRIDALYVQVHRGVLSLFGRQPLFLDDLRLAAALLHSVRCVERMGDQCVNVAKLVPLSERDLAKDLEILELIEAMGIATRQAVTQCRDAFRARDAQLARDLVAQDVRVNRLNRAVFQRATDVGDTPQLREWAMFMVLVARCLERVAGNTVDIAEQAIFVRTGNYRELANLGEQS